MLIEDDRKKIKERFEKLRGDVTILNFTQKLECRFCQPTEEILEELSALSDRIKLEIHNFIEDKTLAEKFKVDKIPATIILGVKDYGVRFYGIPSGYEFSSLIDAIIDVGNGKTDLREETKKKLSELKTPTHIQVFVTPTCPYCQTAVRIGHKMAVETDLICSDMVEATEFPHLAHKYNVTAVPKTVINDRIFFEGAVPEEQFVEKVIEAQDNSLTRSI